MQVTTIDKFAFAYKDTLTSIKIPSTVNRIKSQAFDGCTSLTNIEMVGVKYIGGWSFRDCDSLTTLKLPNSLVTLDQYAFMDCDSLNSVEIPEGLTSIGEGAFTSCKSLTNVKFPQTMEYIGKCAFCQCYSLVNINLPQGIKYIDDSAFMSCKSLINIKIPDTVTSIENDAFYNCNKLTIYGSPGSTAEKYAKSNSIPFKPTIAINSVSGINQLHRSTSKIKLTWNKDSQVSGYYVYRSTSKNGPYKKIAAKSGYNNNTFTDSNLSSGKTYYYKVRAYKLVNGIKVFSDYSLVKSIKVK